MELRLCFCVSHLQSGFLLSSNVLLFCVVPEFLQARSRQWDATGWEEGDGNTDSWYTETLTDNTLSLKFSDKIPSTTAWPSLESCFCWFMQWFDWDKTTSLCCPYLAPGVFMEWVCSNLFLSFSSSASIATLVLFGKAAWKEGHNVAYRLLVYFSFIE